MPNASRLTVPEAKTLMDEARARTGLDDFGAPSFRDGLEQFLSSIKSGSHMFTQEGVDGLTASFVDCLANRLKIEDWYASHPEVEAEQPTSPLMITGLPRTGTTAFVNILSIEPAFRCLRAWEQSSPVPPPTLADETDDPRRIDMMRAIEAMKKEPDGQMTMHLHELDSTTEDVQTLKTEFRAQSFTAPVFEYHKWWRDTDMRAAYAFQKRVVKLLQSRRPPNRWLFKAPHYVFHLEDLCAAYPDAKFVVTHRDPVKTLPSWASLLTSVFPAGSLERVPMEEFGPHIAEHQAIGMRRMIEARARLGEHRFLDVHHHEFVDDPISTLARVYDFIDLPFTAATQSQMTDWSERNRPGRFGKHVYTAAQFGLDERALREQFGFYTDTYDVRLENIGG